MQKFDLLSKSVVCCHTQGVFMLLLVPVNFDGDVVGVICLSLQILLNHIAALFLYILQLFMPVGHLET